MKQQFESVRSGFLLLLAAFIWGIAFVAQSVGMDYMGPCTFNAARFLIPAGDLDKRTDGSQKRRSRCFCEKE